MPENLRCDGCDDETPDEVVPIEGKNLCADCRMSGVTNNLPGFPQREQSEHVQQKYR